MRHPLIASHLDSSARFDVQIAKKAIWSLKTRLNLSRRIGTTGRRLEIGPGDRRIPGYETLSIVGGRNVDYVCDAATRLPFSDNTFETIYASHVLEHIPWYQTARALIEWLRILRPGGELKVWVPDALKICEVFVEYERTGNDRTALDGWYRLNDDRDPCRWAAGRIYTYGDGKGTIDHPNWHRAMFSERFLRKLLADVGFTCIEPTRPDDILGHDHGWINLGLRGRKA